MHEQQRVAHYLAATTEPKLLKVVEAEVVARHAQALIDMEHSGCAVMFDNGKTEDLKRMFALFSRVPKTLLNLQAALSQSVRTRGTELVRDQDEQRLARAVRRSFKDSGLPGRLRTLSRRNLGRRHPRARIRSTDGL